MQLATKLTSAAVALCCVTFVACGRLPNGRECKHPNDIPDAQDGLRRANEGVQRDCSRDPTGRPCANARALRDRLTALILHLQTLPDCES